MSKSAMLRTRRRDVNVKPNRRLDRKSSRGMIYENEELRLRTININAEIERGQSDIKKLRKENEQLRKEIWCLRDEYDKLDRLLKEKEDCTSSSESDSCTSCSESEDPETTQNLENVQKTNLNNLKSEFDHLSVVTEETSAENSDKNSQNSAISPSNDKVWDVLPPDMGYPGPPPMFRGPQNSQNDVSRNIRLGDLRNTPFCQTINTTQSLHLNGSRTLVPPDTLTASPNLGMKTKTLPLPVTSDQLPKHFFSPLKTSKSYENFTAPNATLSSSWNNPNSTYTPWVPESPPQPYSQPVLSTFTCGPSTLPITTPPLNVLSVGAPTVPRYKTLTAVQKSALDILVQSNPDETSSNSFVNGGNLDELLQDIDSISHDILQISSQTNTNTICRNFDAFSPIQEKDEPLFMPENDVSELQNSKIEGPYKTQLSVVLLPKAMPLLEFDKYEAIKSSMESLETFKQSMESLEEVPIKVLKTLSNTPNPEIIVGTPKDKTVQHFPKGDKNPGSNLEFETENNCFTPQPDFNLAEESVEHPSTINNSHPKLMRQLSNPFFYGSFDSYQTTDNFTNRYNPNFYLNETHENFSFKNDNLDVSSNEKLQETHDTLPIGFKTEFVQSDNKKKDDTSKDEIKHDPETKDAPKSPKSKRTRKVSIYFKGKKDKLARSLSLDTKLHQQNVAKSGENPLLDQKTNNPGETKNQTANEISKPEDASKLFGDHQKQDSTDKKDSDNQKSSDSKTSYDRKHRKSSSTSPERKHVHIQDSVCKKSNKKRHRKSERRTNLNRRNSVSTDKFNRDQRSFSVCTDRSNILEHRFGYDEFLTNSERDRSNSLSSCDTIKSRKLSQIPQLPVSGKIPWFACWGNGCL